MIWRLSGMLAGFAAVAAIAAPAAGAVSAPVSASAPCVEAKALEGLGRLDAAEAAYLHELGTASGVDCAKQGLKRLGRRTESCAYPAALQKAGERDSAHSAYLKVLAAAPSSRCAQEGVNHTAATTTFWSWLATAAPNAGKALVALVVGLLLLTILALLLLQIQTRVPGLRKLWPAKAIRRPTLQIEPLNDDALDERLGAAVGGMIRGRISWRTDRFGVNLVSGQAGLATALSGLGDVSGDAKAAVAVIDFLTAVLPRRRFTLTGELQSESAEGRGISLELKSEGSYEGMITFWAHALVVPETATATEVYRSLAVASAAWLDHSAASKLGDGDLLTRDPQSWAVFRCGVDAQRLGDEERARALYDRALVMDGTNVGAMANLGIICRRKNDWDDAGRNLKRALLATEDPNAPPKLEKTLNPDWYRIKYQLAALFTNWAAAPSADVQRKQHAEKACAESVELARETLTAIAKPPSDGLLASSPTGYVEETLLPFLEGTIEPSALVLVACTVDPIPDPPEKPPQNRPDREQLLALLRAPQIDPWPLIAYVETGKHLTPSAHYDLACFYAKAGMVWKATRRLQTAIRETPPSERTGLIEVVRRDPTLQPLREIRPGLTAELAKEFESAVLDAEATRLAKEFDLQSHVYKRLIDEGWTVTWLTKPPEPFMFSARKGERNLLVWFASLSEALTEEQLDTAVGIRDRFERDHLGGPMVPPAVLWVMLHADAPKHKCDGDAAKDRSVEILVAD